MFDPRPTLRSPLAKNGPVLLPLQNCVRIDSDNAAPWQRQRVREGGCVQGLPVTRRKFLSLSAGAGAATLIGNRRTAASEADVIRFGLTPVLLTSDLNLLDLLKSYLEKATGRAVQLVTRRTYEETSAPLISSQLNGASTCSPPFLTYRAQLELLAVPLWNG